MDKVTNNRPIPLSPEDVKHIEAAAQAVRPRFFRERFKPELLGIYFCANCGATPYRNVPANPTPTASCPNCGFDDWIWEPYPTCDVCGKSLNPRAGEDFYDEPRGTVTCADHWQEPKGGR